MGLLRRSLGFTVLLCVIGLGVSSTAAAGVPPIVRQSSPAGLAEPAAATPASSPVSSPHIVPDPTGGAFVSLAPARVLDTRHDQGAPGPVVMQGSVAVQILGKGGVPTSGVSAVLINLTVTGPTRSGYITAWADGQVKPLASNLNFVAGQTIPNLATVPVGSDGKIRLANGSLGTAQLIADVAGYYRSGNPAVAGSFASLPPARVLDTRNDQGAPGPVAPLDSISVQITGEGGVPTSGVSSVVVNLTATGPTTSGYVTAWADGRTEPLASNLNFVAGQTIPNLATVPVGANGRISLSNHSLGTLDLLADVAGYYLSGIPGSTGAFVSLAPARILDTRNDQGAPGPVAALGDVAVQVLGQGGVPAAPVSAVMINLTVTAPTKGGYTTAWADGATKPLASNLNFVAGQTIPNLVTVPVGADGKIRLSNTSPGTAQLIADVEGYFLKPAAALAVSTTVLPDGVGGVSYSQALQGVGGVAPYSWSVTGLPAGLTATSTGLITGFATQSDSAAQITVTVTDAVGATATAALTLSVPTVLPPTCVNQSCAVLTPDTAPGGPKTVQVGANRIGSITRDSAGAATQVLMTGPAPAAGQILVIAANASAPSGLIVLVEGVTANGDGTTTVDVSAAGPADAYADGTVQAIGDPVTTPFVASPHRVGPPKAPTSIPRRSTTKKTGPAAPKPLRPARIGASDLSCDNSGVSVDLHGLDLTPTLTPRLTTKWQHNLSNAFGLFSGNGGLKLFQFDLDGDITIDLGVTVSGSVTCDLDLPTLTARVPAGELGVVLFELDPSLKLEVNGKADIRTSVTLHCGTEYRWKEGQQTRSSSCGYDTEPLHLTSDSGVDATLSAKMDASVTLDDFVGVTGSLNASLHAGFFPTRHPVAEIDAQAGYELGACLICFWKGSPLRVTVASGTFFNRVLASYDTVPPTVPAPTAPVITTTAAPSGTVGLPYSFRLRTADNRGGTWEIVSGDLPAGLSLSGDTLVGKPTTPQRSSFVVTFTDGDSLSASVSLTINVSTAGGGGIGAVQNLDYCHQNVFAANDDSSTDAVPLPFQLDYFGSTWDDVYVSNNGYVTFDGGSGIFTPYPLAGGTSSPIIAPFFADVDTRDPGSALVTYGSSPDGKTFCVDWVGVGYYAEHADKFDSFQLLLTARPDQGAGDFDITFNYGSLDWETGDASGGIGGIGGTAARAGFSAATDVPGSSFELPGSGDSGGLIDGGTHALTSSSQGSTTIGRYVFPVRN